MRERADYDDVMSLWEIRKKVAEEDDARSENGLKKSRDQQSNQGDEDSPAI